MSDSADTGTDTLANQRFKLLERLGSGSTGTVYAAQDRMRGEKVALKVLTYRSASALYRFKREFRTLIDVLHPNLVTFHELFADDGDEVFFTMELVEGINFLDHVRPPKGIGGNELGFGEERLRGTLAQFALAVKALHDRDKIHCDLKPNNVLVDQVGRLVILDFGIARDLAPALSPQSLYMGLSGTVPYMAPEQAQGGEPQPPSDWYSVGVILFQALTGHLPFEGSLVDVLSAKVSKPAPAPDDLTPGLPDDLSRLCSDLLVIDPGQRPLGGEVLMRLSVADQAANDEEPAAPQPDTRVSAAGLADVGRQPVIEALRDAFETSRRGQAVSVYLHGESGMGKTALIQHILHGFIEASGAVVLAGRCYEREMVPYKALDGIIDSLSRYLRRPDCPFVVPQETSALCRLFPVLRRVEPLDEAARHGEEIRDLPSLRRQGFEALRDLLRGIAKDKPLVLYVDDLHWADADSAALLSEIPRAPKAPPVLLLASFRTEEIDAKPFLRSLLAEVDTESRREVTLAPLEIAAAEELARKLLGDAAADLDQLVAAIVHEAQGSPFFIEQLVGYARATESNLSSSIGLGEMLDARLAKLPEGTLDLLRTLAAAGRPLEAAVAWEAAGQGGDERPLVASLKQAHLLRASGSAEHIEFFHNRLRETLARRIDASEKQRIHTRLAETLIQRGQDDPEALYEHFLHAGKTRQAGRQAARAAARARAALAAGPAVRFFRGALEYGEFGEAERLDLLEGLAESLDHAGRPGDSADIYLKLAGVAGRLKALQYRQKAAEELLLGGYFDRGLEVAREVCREVGLDLPTSQRGALTSLLWNRLRLRLRGLGFQRREANQIPQEELVRIDVSWIMAASLSHNWPLHGNDMQTRHLLLALDSGEPSRLSRALNLESSYRSTSGEAPEKTAILRQQALKLARSVRDPHAEGQCILHDGIAMYLAGRWRQAARRCEEAEAYILKHSPVGFWGLLQAQRFGLSCRFYLGDLDLLCQRVPRLLHDAQERGNVLAWTELATRLHVVWLAMDEPSVGRRTLGEALDQRSSQKGFHIPHFNALIGRCQADLYEGDEQQALKDLTEQWPRLRRSLLMRLALVSVESHFLRGRVALAAAGQPESARECLRLAERAAGRLASVKTACGPTMAGLLRAGIEARRGNQAASMEWLDQAIQACESQDMGLYAAVARRRLGELISGEEGLEKVRAADHWMQQQRIVRPDRMTAVLLPGF